MCVHRCINFNFNEAGRYWQNTGKSAKFGQKIGTFTHIKPKFAIFVHFYIFTDILTISYWTQYSSPS